MIAGYVRCSTIEQKLHGYSVGEQQERITAYCKSMGWGTPKIFTDAGFTGANLNRPAMQEMIEGVKNGTITRVVVYKLDRLSRSQKDTLQLLEDLFIPNNVDFVSMSESFQLTSAFGVAMVGILSVFAQLERSTIRERVTIGREARAKKGMYHGGHMVPVGYDYIDGRLVVNDFEAMQVRECFRMFLTGYTFTEISDTLNKKGWTHKNGRWMMPRVRYVLLNPVYIGKVKFSGKIYDGIHEPIIDVETFTAAGEKINRNHKTYKRTTKGNAYMVGKIFCGKCGARYTHTTSINGHDKKNPRISYYSCHGRVHSKRMGYKCDNKIHRADVIDGIVFDSMRELVMDDIKEYRQEQSPDTLKALQRELAKIEKQRSRLIDLYSVGTFNADELTAKIEPLNERLNAIDKQIQNTERRSMDEMKVLVDSIGGIIDDGNPVAIRQLVDALVDRIEINGEDITIYWDFD